MHNSKLYLEDIINVRDIMSRVEELEHSRDEYDEWHSTPGAWAALDEDGEPEELTMLQGILDDLKGYGGDEQWCGDWYPATLISDLGFTKYVEELLHDCGAVPANIPDYIVIDWDATARNIQADYTSVEIDDFTYWFR